MFVHGIGVVAHTAISDTDLADFTQCDKVVQRVVHRGQAHFGHESARRNMDLLSGQVHMLTGHGLGHRSSLGRQPPTTSLQPVEQIAIHGLSEGRYSLVHDAMHLRAPFLHALGYTLSKLGIGGAEVTHAARNNPVADFAG